MSPTAIEGILLAPGMLSRRQNRRLIKGLGGLRMRLVYCVLACLALSGLAFSVQARNATENERYLCRWGSSIAGGAQASKLSGVTRYGARQKLQARKFVKQWMRPMALRITEQTYDSESRLKPDAVSKVYYDGCIQHEVARR
ncbi:Valyl-tRNA synthetase [Pseudomonas coronafaciens pv. coronafaciens]|nr:Valyl-tRNA synthetase [Pseudomonas coronafaciens pv. coronafaciens]